MEWIDIYQNESYNKKAFFCWRCLSRIRWVPNPHQIKDMIDLQNRPERERKLAMTTHGISPKELIANPYIRAREYGVHALNPNAYYLSMLNLFDQPVIEWREEGGEYVPYCPNCSIPLINQKKWFYLKKWLKYPLIVALLGLSLWFIGSVLLGRG